MIENLLYENRECWEEEQEETKLQKYCMEHFTENPFKYKDGMDVVPPYQLYEHKVCGSSVGKKGMKHHLLICGGTTEEVKKEIILLENYE